MLIVTAAILVRYGGNLPWKAAREATAPPNTATVPAVAPLPAPNEPTGTAPSFDIVRVDPGGHAVIAGRAAPGAQVTVLADGKVLGQVTADMRGEWVLVPDAALAPGDRRLSLEATDPTTGGRSKSAETVALEVAPSATPAPGVAVLVPDNPEKAAAVLQSPGGPSTPGMLTIDTADSNGRGQVTLAGQAAPGATVRVTAGSQVLGTVTANAQGLWTLQAPLAAAQAQLNAEIVAANGAAAQRVSQPFAPPEMSVPAGRDYVVRRGNNLWWLARQTYGNGMRYTAIYQANRGRIRNPDLIYPGQVFVIPKS
jgi:nucleoid-associated protein YgaU